MVIALTEHSFAIPNLAGRCWQKERTLMLSTVNRCLAALRFFFVKTLHRPWNTAETPYPKRVINLPKVMSPEEVGLLIESADLPFYRVILMTLYATGVRRAELANMRVSDIDSKRMVIRVRGKGLNDRSIEGFEPTSPALPGRSFPKGPEAHLRTSWIALGLLSQLGACKFVMLEHILGAIKECWILRIPDFLGSVSRQWRRSTNMKGILL
jgi:integrase